MSDIEFLERNLGDIGERRTPQTAVMISKVLGQFAGNNLAGSEAHAFTEREEVKKQFDACVKEMAKFYVGFCESEELPLERNLDYLRGAGSKVVDEWSSMTQNRNAACRQELLHILDNTVKNAARGYVGLEQVYKKQPAPLRRLRHWAFASTEKVVLGAIGVVLAAAAVAYLGLR